MHEGLRKPSESITKPKRQTGGRLDALRQTVEDKGKLDKLQKLVTGNALFKWFEKLFTSDKTKKGFSSLMGMINGVLDWLKEDKPRESSGPRPAKPAEVASEAVANPAPGDVELSAIDQANQQSNRPLAVNDSNDLSRLNPSLSSVIGSVCASVGVDRALVECTFKVESAFELGAVGDTNFDQPSLGLGQFRPATWERITRLPAYQNALNEHYPNQTFGPGENALADTLATALYLKLIAERFSIDPRRRLNERSFVAVRSGYNAGEGNVERILARYDALQMNPSERGQQPKTDALIDGYLTSFNTYQRFASTSA